MKKICHVTSAHPEEDGRIFRRACVSGAKAGYDTYLVERGDSYKKDNVTIVGIGKPKKSTRLYRMTKFANMAFRAAVDVDADLYQLHDPELLPYALKLKKMGKAVVFDSHENYVEQLKHKSYLPRPVSAIISFAFNKYSSYVFSKIDGLTYPGNSGESSVFDGKCRLVAPSDNLPWLSELYDKYDSNIKREQGTACYIGSLDESRGITNIIKASYDAGCTLYLAGRFYPDSYRDDLEKLKEYECVKYLGVIDRNQIEELLQKVQIGFCTLLDVGQYHKMLNLPTKVYEYMSMGMPVIINKSPYNNRIVEELGFGKCVDPDDIQEIKNALVSLLNDESTRKNMGNNGRKAIKGKYCWDNAQQGLLGMYETILGR